MITVETLGSSSKGNCYRLQSGGRSLLLECGLPWKEIRRELNFETTDLAGCLSTHLHNDHFGAAVDVLKAGVDLYASLDTLRSKSAQHHHRAYKVEAGDYFHINGFGTGRAFEAIHDAPCLGFIITDMDGDRGDSLFFLTDSAYCKYLIPIPIGIIMIEANFDEAILRRNVDAGYILPSVAKRIRENHMSIDRVIDFLKANDLSRCKEIRLLHLSDGNGDAADFKRRVQEATGIMTIVEDE